MLTGPTRPGRPYVRQVAEHQQMDGDHEPCNGHQLVLAISHSAAVTLTSDHVLSHAVCALSAAQREQTARAAQRRRFKRKPAGMSTFVIWTVDT